MPNTFLTVGGIVFSLVVAISIALLENKVTFREFDSLRSTTRVLYYPTAIWLLGTVTILIFSANWDIPTDEKILRGLLYFVGTLIMGYGGGQMINFLKRK